MIDYNIVKERKQILDFESSFLNDDSSTLYQKLNHDLR